MPLGSRYVAGIAGPILIAGLSEPGRLAWGSLVGTCALKFLVDKLRSPILTRETDYA